MSLSIQLKYIKQYDKPDIKSVTNLLEVVNFMSETAKYRVYTDRWLMLALFCFLNFSNAVLWVTFAPISDLTSDYFDGIGVTAVNLLALVFQIVYLPGTLLGVIASKKYGLREAVLIGL